MTVPIPFPGGVLFLNDKLDEDYRHDGQAKELLEEKLPDLVEKAVELAPDDPLTTENDLPRGIVGEVVDTEDGYVGKLISSNFKGAWYEFGTERQAARPYLRPAAIALGYTLTGGRDA